MNILLLNWRDPKNPKSGGAEKLNLHILKPLIERGDNVIWYATSVKGLPEKEIYQGITIVRFGNPLTHLMFWPFLYWRGKFGSPDIIIDSIHGTGYLSTIFAPKVKKIILICEVAQNIWDEMYSFPVNIIGKLWEKVMFKFYKNNNFWTISESTKKDLITFGISEKHIDVLPMGFDGVTLSKLPPKHSVPTALFVGRLAEMKGIKDAIKAVTGVNNIGDKKWYLRIIGRGEESYENELKSLVKDLKQQDNITFLGYVSEKDKFEEMAKAWVLLVPSSREGWGMIVPEANSVGTPAIGYDVPGLSEVLRKYSKLNIIVAKQETFLQNSLENFKLGRVKENINPGWEEWYTYIASNV